MVFLKRHAQTLMLIVSVLLVGVNTFSLDARANPGDLSSARETFKSELEKAKTAFEHLEHSINENDDTRTLNEFRKLEGSERQIAHLWSEGLNPDEVKIFSQTQREINKIIHNATRKLPLRVSKQIYLPRMRESFTSNDYLDLENLGYKRLTEAPPGAVVYKNSITGSSIMLKDPRKQHMSTQFFRDEREGLVKAVQANGDYVHTQVAQAIADEKAHMIGNIRKYFSSNDYSDLKKLGYKPVDGALPGAIIYKNPKNGSTITLKNPLRDFMSVQFTPEEREELIKAIETSDNYVHSQVAPAIASERAHSLGSIRKYFTSNDYSDLERLGYKRASDAPPGAIIYKNQKTGSLITLKDPARSYESVQFTSEERENLIKAIEINNNYTHPLVNQAIADEKAYSLGKIRKYFSSNDYSDLEKLGYRRTVTAPGGALIYKNSKTGSSIILKDPGRSFTSVEFTPDEREALIKAVESEGTYVYPKVAPFINVKNREASALAVTANNLDNRLVRALELSRVPARSQAESDRVLTAARNEFNRHGRILTPGQEQIILDAHYVPDAEIASKASILAQKGEDGIRLFTIEDSRRLMTTRYRAANGKVYQGITGNVLADLKSESLAPFAGNCTENLLGRIFLPTQ